MYPNGLIFGVHNVYLRLQISSTPPAQGEASSAHAPLSARSVGQVDELNGTYHMCAHRSRLLAWRHHAAPHERRPHADYKYVKSPLRIGSATRCCRLISRDDNAGLNLSKTNPYITWRIARLCSNLGTWRSVSISSMFSMNRMAQMGLKSVHTSYFIYSVCVRLVVAT